MAIDRLAVLGIKVDPSGAVAGSARSKAAINSIGQTAGRVKNAIFSLQGALVGLGAGATLKSIITTASEVESLQVRLKFLTGSVEDASEAFDTMNEFAKRVPFSLQDIEMASPSLLTVADDVSQLNELLEITGDIAAVSGLTFTETAQQLQRAFSSGIASADLFKERGVAAFLGFQSGVSVSAEETKKRIRAMWRDGTTTAKGATNELADTFQGQVSMMQDAWRELKLVVADAGVFEQAAFVIEGITDGLKDPAFKTGVEAFSTNLVDLFRFTVENKEALLAVGATFLGAQVAGVFGLGKKGRTSIAAISGMAAAIALLNDELRAAAGLSVVDPAMLGDIVAIEKEMGRLEDQIARLNDANLGGSELAESLSAQYQILADALLELSLGHEHVIEVTSGAGQETEKAAKSTSEYAFAMYRFKNAAMAGNAELEKMGINTKGVGADYNRWKIAVVNGAPEMESAWRDIGEAVRDSWESVGNTVENSLADAMLGLTSWRDATKTILQEVAREFIKVYILRDSISKITSGIGDFFNLNTGSSASSTLADVHSFDGGGFTGRGSRSGGIDGRGGFPAILHPNETVVDHTKGQGGGVVIQQTINISTGVQQTVRTEIANMLPQIAQASKAAVLDARKRGGSFAGAFA